MVPTPPLGNWPRPNWPAQLGGQTLGGGAKLASTQGGGGQLPPWVGTEPDRTLSRRPRRGQHHTYDLGDPKYTLFWMFSEDINKI